MLPTEAPVNVDLNVKKPSDSLALQADESTGDIAQQDEVTVDSSTSEEQVDEEKQEMQIALEKLLETKCFEGFEGKAMSYIWTTQLTCSNVMSTKITVRPCPDNPAAGKNGKKSNSSFLDGGNSSQTIGGNGTSSSLLRRAISQTEFSDNQEPFQIYSQAYGSNRSKQKASNKKSKGNYKSKLTHQAQLPTFRRSLPALPIPVNRLNQELLKERDRFMIQLLKEREEKQLLENWAATKIQALYRSYCVRRPRQKAAEIIATRGQRLNTLANIRSDLTEMHETLVKQDILSLPAAPLVAATTASLNYGRNNFICGPLTSGWRKSIQERASNKREAKHRKDRMHHAATKIQACVKRFLARIGYLHLFTRRRDEIFLAAIIKVQSVYRVYRVRCKMAKIVERLQREAATQIQCLIRGISARERVSMIRFDRQSRHYEENAATAGTVGGNGSSSVCGSMQVSSSSHHPLYSFPRKSVLSASSTVTKVSSLRPLYISRKSRQAMEFKTPKWYEERIYLSLHKISVRLYHKKDIMFAAWYYQASSQSKKKSGSPVSRGNSPKNRSRRLGRRQTVRGAIGGANSNGVLNLSPDRRKSKQVIHAASSFPHLKRVQLLVD